MDYVTLAVAIFAVIIPTLLAFVVSNKAARNRAADLIEDSRKGRDILAETVRKQNGAEIAHLKELMEARLKSIEDRMVLINLSHPHRPLVWETLGVRGGLPELLAIIDARLAEAKAARE